MEMVRKRPSAVGMMRVRNEARWIKRCVRALLRVCDRVYVMDDASTDATAAICRKIKGVTVLDTPFDSLNEARDKNWLYRQLPPCEWVVCVDGDEELHSDDACLLLDLMARPEIKAVSARILYLWDEPCKVRVDGIYGAFYRPSAFRWLEGGRFLEMGDGCNFHCSSIIEQRLKQYVKADVRLLHYGYLHKEDRIRKYGWYNERDPNNRGEDCYRHMIVGDLLPAETRTKYSGPLRVESLDAA